MLREDLMGGEGESSGRGKNVISRWDIMGESPEVGKRLKN